MSRSYDLKLAPGARNAIRVCLNVQPSERVTIITDRFTQHIAEALAAEVVAVGASYELFVLEELTERPMKTMPSEVLAGLHKSQVSIFAAGAQTGELNARSEMLDVVNKQRIRHGHMLDINDQIMTEGMHADYNEIYQLGQWLTKQAEAAKSLRVTAPNGTDLKIDLAPGILHWHSTSGLITTKKWGNLPGGEVLSSPKTVNGIIVAEGVGDYFGPKYGVLNETPLKIKIVDGRIVDFVCDNKALLAEVLAYVKTDENSNRVGEVAMGTNLAVKKLCGLILQDEKMPGFHLAFGNPYPEHTGQSWSSTTHLDCVVGNGVNIRLDDTPVMENGTYLWPGAS